MFQNWGSDTDWLLAHPKEDDEDSDFLDDLGDLTFALPVVLVLEGVLVGTGGGWLAENS